MNQGLHEADRLKRNFRDTIKHKQPSFKSPDRTTDPNRNIARERERRGNMDAYR